MSRNVHPYPTFTTYYDSQKNRTSYEQVGCIEGMSVKQLWLGQILVALATNPATMLDPEAHVDYAVKLVNMAYEKSGG